MLTFRKVYNFKEGITMKKMIMLLLALIMVLSLFPVSAMALTKFPPIPEPNPELIQNPPPKLPDEIRDEIIAEQIKDKVSKFPKKAAPIHPDGQHEYSYASNPTYHWFQCPCGCQVNKEPHIDPMDAENDYCFCGYHFSDNADLVTLWINGCPPIKKFNKNTTEYKLNAYTYKDVKEIKVSTRTFDSEATVELPEDLTLKEGENKFDIKVVSENKKVTKVYTVIITKEAKK